MPPRTILYTGKGGVGKTSVAASTARIIAGRGVDTIVLSTDPAHSLADCLQVEVGGEPTPVSDHLWAQQVAAQDEMERNWAAVQDWLGELLPAPCWTSRSPGKRSSTICSASCRTSSR
jgi:arsenite/tail-anchored protein-transporting ATPase